MSEIRLEGTSRSGGNTVNPSDPLRETREKLEEAERLRQQGKLNRAQAICEALVRSYPDYFGALHTLGLICADKGGYPLALGYLVRAVMLNPRSWTTLTALSGVYLRLGASEMAAQTLEQARLIKPQDANILATLGEIYREEREYEFARDAFRQAFALNPSLEVAIGLGMCCAQLGQYAEAVELFENFIKRGRRSLGLLFALNLLPQSVVSIDVLAELDKVVRDKSEDEAEFENSAAFIRAAALHKASRYAEAWQQLLPANRTLFPAKQEALRDLTELNHTTLAWLRGNPIKARGDRKTDGARAISLFILGPSRSGKTSMERLVATLDGVKRGYENPSVETAIRRAFQTAGLLASGLVAHLPPEFYSSCRDIYLEELARRAGSARVFTNTHPGAIHEAGRIVALFPHVRFIFVKRNLEDIMLRIYMRKYMSGNPYAYDLKSIRDYVTWYHQIIDVLAEKLPDSTRVIHYEDMIADPAAALRVAAELCGLSIADGPLPPLGDDRGCAEPYRQLMAEELQR